MALIELVAGRLWHVQQPVKLGGVTVFTRMTVVRLSDGSLWVHSPAKPEANITADLRSLGEVRHVVAPNNSHHMHFRSFLKAFPRAQGYISPALAAKHPALAEVARVGDLAGIWDPDLHGFFMEGLPQLDETVWFHPLTGTLVLTDLLFCINGDRSLFVRAIARAVGVHKRLAMSRTMKALIKDRAALARSVAPLRSLELRRVIVAHEEIVDRDAARKLSTAFTWLDRADLRNRKPDVPPLPGTNVPCICARKN